MKLHRYKYLNDKEGRTPEDTIECALNSRREEYTDQSLIIRDESDRKYIVFPNYHAFECAYPTNSRHLVHEIIFGWRNQRPKFDLDKMDPLTFTDTMEEIVADIYLAFTETYDAEPNIEVCDSSNDEIKSAHIIITNYCFRNSREADWFTRTVLPNYLQGHLLKYVDMGVNKSIQSFRTPFSTKDGRTKIPKTLTRLNTMITTTEGLCQELPLMAPSVVDYKAIPTGTDPAYNDIINNIIDVNIWILYKQSGNRYDYHRLRPAFCDICNREHQHENMFVVEKLNTLIMYCRRNKQQSKVIYTAPIDTTNMYFGDYNKFINNTPRFDDIIAWINKNIFYIVNGGNSFYITRNSIDNNTRYEITKTLNCLSDVHLLTIDNIVNGPPLKLLSVIKSHRHKIQYNHIDFVPYPPTNPYIQDNQNVFNMFTKLAAVYDPALDINMTYVQPWLDHVYNILSAGSAQVYNYIINWLAHICQRPNQKIGTALVFKSAQGAGKNIFFEFIIDHVIGPTYSIIADNIDQLTGRFNSVIEHKLLTVCDEVQNFGGAFKSNDRLKSLITQRRLNVERKGMDIFAINDYNHYVFLTNNDWPIKVEHSDRRYVAVDVDESRIGDTNYFNALGNISTAAAGTHFYNWLMRLELNVNLRQIPDTNLRNELKLNSVAEPIIWLIKVIREEQDPIRCGIDYKSCDIYENFMDWYRTNGGGTNYTKRLFLLAIGKIIKPTLKRVDGMVAKIYNFNANEITTKIKEYLKLPDLDIAALDV